MTMTSSYLLLLLRTEAEVRELQMQQRAAEIAAGDDAGIPDIDDGWKFDRLRDPYLSSECYFEKAPKP